MGSNPRVVQGEALAAGMGIIICSVFLGRKPFVRFFALALANVRLLPKPERLGKWLKKPERTYLQARFLARSTPPMPPPITASPFVTGLHLPLEPHLVALPLLSQITTTNTQNQPAFGLPMHAILRIADPSPWHFT